VVPLIASALSLRRIIREAARWAVHAMRRLLKRV
jgi:hypothetical protein